MNRSYKIIPVYTGDVSGVCSALYELGGMTVIHDPSGCNSTYNTHDETRWYDQDSLIFLSGLNHVDAIMGNDEKLIEAVVRSAKKLHPKFIAVTSSPVPYINGTDFKAICRLIEKRTGIPAFFVQTNGMHDYSVGVGNALKEIAIRYVKKQVIPGSRIADAEEAAINILGMTPLDFAHPDSLASLKEYLTKDGWKKIFCFAMGDSLEHLQQASTAKVSLVISLAGLSAAKYLQETYGIPYVVGVPVPGFRQQLSNVLICAAITGTSGLAYEQSLDEEEYPIKTQESVKKTVLIGEPVLMESVAAALRINCGIQASVVSSLEDAKELLLPGDQAVKGEEEAETILQSADIVFADPLYRPICDQNVSFISMPHLAFSGRCFIKSMPNYLEENYYEQLK